MKKIIIKYILKRLTETSTIRGLVILFGTAIGYHFSGAQTDDIVYIVLGIVGLIGSVLPDSIRDVVEDTVKERVKTEPTTTVKEDVTQEQQGFGDKS